MVGQRASKFFLPVLLIAMMQFRVVSAVEFDHSLWDQLLQEHVQAELVNYQNIKAQPQKLQQYLEQIAAFSPAKLAKLPENSRIAFYLNAYNAITVKRILDHYPPQRGMLNFINPKVSIKNISGAWDKIQNKVAGQMLTLNDIEHNILRKEYQEPRIHVGLVCASIGCPPLQNRAFTGEKLHKQLEAASRGFITGRARNKFCIGCDQVQISKIFKWYGDDFKAVYPPSKELARKHGEKIASVITFAAAFFPPQTKAFLLKGDYEVGYLDYDWSLNEPK